MRFGDEALRHARFDEFLSILSMRFYIKTESIEFCAILWVLLGGILVGLLPGIASTTGTLLLVLGIAAIL